MTDAFQIIPTETAAKLVVKLDTLFDCQSTNERTQKSLARYMLGIGIIGNSFYILICV